MGGTKTPPCASEVLRRCQRRSLKLAFSSHTSSFILGATWGVCGYGGCAHSANNSGWHATPFSRGSPCASLFVHRRPGRARLQLDRAWRWEKGRKKTSRHSCKRRRRARSHKLSRHACSEALASGSARCVVRLAGERLLWLVVVGPPAEAESCRAALAMESQMPATAYSKERYGSRNATLLGGANDSQSTATTALLLRTFIAIDVGPTAKGPSKACV